VREKKRDRGRERHQRALGFFCYFIICLLGAVLGPARCGSVFGSARQLCGFKCGQHDELLHTSCAESKQRAQWM